MAATPLSGSARPFRATRTACRRILRTTERGGSGSHSRGLGGAVSEHSLEPVACGGPSSPGHAGRPALTPGARRRVEPARAGRPFGSGRVSGAGRHRRQHLDANTRFVRIRDPAGTRVVGALVSWTKPSSADRRSHIAWGEMQPRQVHPVGLGSRGRTVSLRGELRASCGAASPRDRTSTIRGPDTGARESTHRPTDGRGPPPRPR